MRSLVLAVAALVFLAGAAHAKEDAVPGSSGASKPSTRRLPGEGSAIGHYALEALEKLGWGAADLGMAVPELVATPFRDAFWGERTKRPVVFCFLMGIPEGAMNSSIRAGEGFANVMTFFLAADRNRFANFSIWYWRRHDGVNLPWFKSERVFEPRP